MKITSTIFFFAFICRGTQRATNRLSELASWFFQLGHPQMVLQASLSMATPKTQQSLHHHPLQSILQRIRQSHLMVNSPLPLKHCTCNIIASDTIKIRAKIA